MVSSPLHAWVNKLAVLPEKFRLEPDNSGSRLEENGEGEWAVSVALEEGLPLYSIAQASWHSLRETRRATNDYLQRASALVGGLWGGSLDSEERDLVLSSLGEPPAFCLPIYIVSVGTGESERAVYVGKTCSSKRFANGHKVGLKLHHPEYDRLKKTVYRCSVLFHIQGEYVALEWLESEALANQTLDIVESVLIYALQSELNIAKRRRPRLERPLRIHMQNYAESAFLSDLLLCLRNGEPISIVPARNQRQEK
jgi:hypothetical protein